MNPERMPMPPQDGEKAPETVTLDAEEILGEEEAAELGGKLELAATREAANLVIEGLKGGSAADMVKDYLSGVETSGGDVEAAKKALAERLAELAKAKFAIAEGSEDDDPAAAQIRAEAAEIDSVSRSLEAKSEVTTEAGKGFQQILESGRFASREETMTAFGALAKGGEIELASGAKLSIGAASSNDIAVLHDVAEKYWDEQEAKISAARPTDDEQPPASGEQSSGDNPVSDEEMDDLFGKLTG